MSSSDDDSEPFPINSEYFFSPVLINDNNNTGYSSDDDDNTGYPTDDDDNTGYPTDDDNDSDNDLPELIAIYTTDGLDEQSYNCSDVKEQKTKISICEGCRRYFKDEAYEHKNRYNLGIEGVNICIHCYFSFNITKYVNNINLTIDNKKCIKYYIKYFTQQHNTNTCIRMKVLNKCLLCDIKNGLTLSYTIEDKIVYEKQKEHHIDNRARVIKSNSNTFVLRL